MSLLTRIREFIAPEGFQDSAGFHFGKPPHDPRGNLTEQARPLSPRASTPACRKSAAVAGVGLFPSVHSSELPRGH